MLVNSKRVERLYQEAQLPVRRRKRKKVSVGERQPLARPDAADQMWSMDFVFDRTADGRVLKCLTITDDATNEAVAIEVERAMSGASVTSVLDRLALSRGLPQVIRSDNGREFCGKAMLEWAHKRGVALRLIEPGKPNQNAYVERFNGRLRDECLNETLVPQSASCANSDRNLAPRIQRGASQESARWTDARSLCQEAGRDGLP